MMKMDYLNIGHDSSDEAEASVGINETVAGATLSITKLSSQLKFIYIGRYT